MAKNMEDYDVTAEEEADQPYEGVSADYYDDSAAVDWVDEEGLEESHDVKFEETQNFWMLGWGNGYLPILDEDGQETAETLTGLYIPFEMGIAPNKIQMPQNLLQVIDKLVASKKMRKVTVKHDDGAHKRYCLFVDGTYKLFPLMLGLPEIGKWDNRIIPNASYRLNGAMPDPNNLLGVVCGRQTTILRKDFLQTTTNMCAVLMVIDLLFDAGYKDSDGMPVPLMFKGTGFGKDELADVLRKHVKAVLRAKSLAPDKYKNAEPWQFGLVLHHDKKPVKHVNKKNEGSNAYAVHALMPDQIDLKYLDSMYCGKDKELSLKKLVKEQFKFPDGRRGIRAGGAAIRWCRSYAIFLVNRQRDLNPISDMYPNGELEWGKKKPFSMRLVRKYGKTSQQNANVAEEQDRVQPRRSHLAPPPVEVPAEVDYYATVEALITEADRQGKSDIVESLIILHDSMEQGSITTEQADIEIGIAQKALKPATKPRGFGRRAPSPQ
jgi:hypothetical protein